LIESKIFSLIITTLIIKLCFFIDKNTSSTGAGSSSSSDPGPIGLSSGPDKLTIRQVVELVAKSGHQKGDYLFFIKI
jgi:hypothetical protein